MIRGILMGVMAAVALAACTPTPSKPSTTGVVARLTQADTPKIQFRQLDTINAIRQAKSMGALVLSPELISAANTHALDMSRQNRPWHFGSNGSSPLDRIAVAGYVGTLVGENISESFEDDLTTLKVWLNDDVTRQSIIDPAANSLGIGWFQEQNGKMWWVQIIGK